MARLQAAPAWRVAVALFALLLIVYAATATWDVLQVNDTRSTAAAAWGLGTSGEVPLPAQWQDLPWRAVTPRGEVVSNRLPGAIVWGAVFYAVAPVPHEVPMAHAVPMGPAALAAATSVALAMALLFLAFDRLVDDRRWALGGALTMALGTPSWSISADALWTHGPAQLGIAAALLALAMGRWWLAGAALGWAMFARPQVGAAALVIGLGLAWVHRSPRPAIAVGLGATPGLLGLMAWSRRFFGTWAPVGGYGEGSVQATVTTVTGAGSAAGGWTVPLAVRNLWPLFTNPARGILWYTPWLWLALPGLRGGWRAAPAWVRWSALGGVGALALQLAINAEWHGGHDQFGYRIALECLTLASPLLLLSFRHTVERFRFGRVAGGLVVAASVLMFAAGATFADPRNHQRAGFEQLIAELGPNGEGFDPRKAVGPDTSRD